MTQAWDKIKKDYWYPAWPLCWSCRVRNATQLHHWLPKGIFKDRKKHKFLNRKENAFPICDACHKTAHTQEFRSVAYQVKCYELGKDVIDSWLDLLDMKVRENYDQPSDTS